MTATNYEVTTDNIDGQTTFTSKTDALEFIADQIVKEDYRVTRNLDRCQDCGTMHLRGSDG